MSFSKRWLEQQPAFLSVETNIEQAHEELRHANRLLNEIENERDFSFDTLDLIARSLRRADQQLIAAINGGEN